MEGRASDWRPGPTVCRCCLTEGCYKDISTEYFWMGKREVYAEMLSETLNVSIAFSKSGGPNSNSRLICEPCIARLRDASEFKRQVVDCEKTFMHHLDPGSSSRAREFNVETTGEVKVEVVKREKASLSDDDFDDRPDFLDVDTDDDLDDQPLTKLASKIPKKESVDLLDLLDSSQITVKRKSNLKLKEAPPKKIIKKKEVVKPSVSKTTPVKQAEKKKGKKNPNKEDIQVKIEEVDIESEKHSSLKDAVNRRAAFRSNIATILRTSTAYPFKYRNGAYLCYFCSTTFIEPERLRDHFRTAHSQSNKPVKPSRCDFLKMDFADISCKLCNAKIYDYAAFKIHLKEHENGLDFTWGESVLPYKLNKEEHTCQVCGKRYELFLSLHKHMNEHFEHYICETCGKRFATSQRMLTHARTHVRGVFPCRRCEETFESSSALYNHVSKVHRMNKRYKCPICNEKFVSYKHRLKHLSSVHGQNTAIFPCPSCTKVFTLCSQRSAHVRCQHLQERNHICQECGMKFFKKCELKMHSVKHGGARIFECVVCKKAYSRAHTLKEHMRIHNNDRRFICTYCGFVQKCSLKSHMRTHHSDPLPDVKPN